MFRRQTTVQTVLGHVVPEPRMTARAWWMLLLRLGVPVLILGALLDLLMQLLFGLCTGLWCLAA